MTLRTPIEYDQASPTVKAVYDDIMATRKTNWVNNFWKVLAQHPENLQRIWSNIKQVMGKAQSRTPPSIEAWGASALR